MPTQRITIAVAALAMTIALIAPDTAAATANPPVTVQAQEADAGFLAYAPAPTAGPPGALCLVDTGVNSNPDTSPGLLASYALDNGAAGDADPQGHGTIEAMIAGAAGNGMIGAWPMLKIVSVRQTTDPGSGQEPTYQFQDYYEGMNTCEQYAVQDHVKAVLLALNSTIGGSPDQTAAFAQAVQKLESNNIAVVASAGNGGGAVQEPASEPGVLAVGASTAQAGSLSETVVGSPCTFSATGSGVSLFAPGCGLDQGDPFTDQPFCCGDGTSQAAAFLAASLVALMSYDSKLSYTTAENLLVQSAAAGQNLDVAAAFKADGLASVVVSGTNDIPQPPPTGPTGSTGTTNPASGTTGTTGSRAGPTGATGVAITRPAHHKRRETIRLRSIAYNAQLKSLAVELAGVGRGNRVTITLTYRHRRPRTIRTHGGLIALSTTPPLSVRVGVWAGRRRIWSTTRRV